MVPVGCRLMLAALRNSMKAPTTSGSSDRTVSSASPAISRAIVDRMTANGTDKSTGGLYNRPFMIASRVGTCLVLAASVLSLACFSGCSNSPSQTQPTATNPPGTALGEIAPQLSITVDKMSSAVPIAGYSDVSFDASGSTGADSLRFSLDFGDGTAPATTAVATHMYTAEGIYTATLTATSPAGRTASTRKTINVKSLRATWFHGAFNANARVFELRRLTITEQNRGDLRGVYYSSTAPADRSFGGTIGADRNIRLSLDDQTVQFEGTIPATFDADGSAMEMRVRGGSASGQSLPFQPVVGTPTGSAPIARLSIRIDSQNAQAAISALSPIRYDAAGSSGERIASVIEFGDGTYTTESTATHPCMCQTGMIT